MAQGARMSVIAWRHRKKIRMGLAPKRRLWKDLLFGSRRFRAVRDGDVERAMRLHDGSRRQPRQSRQTAAQPEAIIAVLKRLGLK